MLYAVFANTIAEKVELAKAEKTGSSATLNGEELDRRFMMAWTKEKASAYGKKWRAENKEKISEYMKQYREENKEDIRIYRKKYYIRKGK